MRRTIIKPNTKIKTREVSCCWCALLFYSTLYPVCSSNIWNLTNWHNCLTAKSQYWGLLFWFVLLKWVKLCIIIFFFFNPWVKIDLSVCSTGKHGCSVTPLICLPEHTVYLFKNKKNKKGCKLLKMIEKKKKSDSPYQRRLLVTINYQFQTGNWKIKWRKCRYQLNWIQNICTKSFFK